MAFIFVLLVTLSTAVSAQGILSESEAILRSQQIAQIHYQLEFNFLDVSKNSYTAKAKINFQYLGRPKDLRLDFNNSQAKKIEINGQKADGGENGEFLRLSKKYLKEGNNEVTVEFTQNYSGTDLGLKKFTDLEDHQVYLHTHFEPYAANQAFPCFDQPDLKAVFQLRVQVPKNFIVVSATRESRVIEDSGGRTWEFPDSPRISPYVFSIQAGPYKVIESVKKGAIPLRLLMRASMSSYIDAKEWLDLTARGLRYFEREFDVAYPFLKYDQLIVPDEKGAMENVAAVTFSESDLPRRLLSRAQKLLISRRILHEMAHMWFGDLVTMRWWKDLWLKESFAEFMSYQAVDEITVYKEAWQSFLSAKSRAYALDELSITHPIVADTANTDEAYAHFDAITYVKGAAVLKQLAKSLGVTFKTGVRDYLKKYSGGTAELKDFLSSLGMVSGKDLKPWAQSWLETAGVNHIRADWVCVDHKTKDFQLLQTTPAPSTRLRSHTFQVAFLTTKPARIVKKKNKKMSSELKGLPMTMGPIVTVTIDKEIRDVPPLNGLPCPLAVDTNDADDGYFRSDIAPEIVKKLLPQVAEIPSAFRRDQIWRMLWEQVVAGHLSVFEYTYWLSRVGLEKEQDPLVLQTLYDTIFGATDGGHYGDPSVLSFIPKSTAQEKVEYQDQLSTLEDMTWKRLRQAPAGSELQKIFFDGFTGLSETKLALDNVRSLLNGQTKLSGFKIDPDQRWWLIFRLARVGQSDAEDLIQSEQARDLSNQGEEQSRFTRAVLPSWTEKSKFLDHLKSDLPKPINTRHFLANGALFPRNQFDLRDGYQKQYFSDLKLMDSKNASLAKDFVFLGPDNCDAKSTVALAEFDKSNHLHPAVHQSLQRYIEMGQICQKAMTVARATEFRPPDLPQVPETRRHRRRRHHSQYN